MLFDILLIFLNIFISSNFSNRTPITATSFTVGSTPVTVIRFKGRSTNTPRLFEGSRASTLVVPTLVAYIMSSGFNIITPNTLTCFTTFVRTTRGIGIYIISGTPMLFETICRASTISIITNLAGISTNKYY